MERDSLLGVVGSNRSWREVGWLLLGLPLGVTWGAFAITMYAVGGSLVIIWLGVLLTAAAQVAMRWIGAAERGVLNAILNERIPKPDPVPSPNPNQPVAMMRWIHQRTSDGHAWRVATWCVVRLVTGPVGFVIAVAAVVAPVAAAGSFVLAILFVVGPLRVTSTSDVVLDGSEWWWVIPAAVVVAAVLVPALWWLMRGFTSLHRLLARWALGPSAHAGLREATQRAELAEEQVRVDQELHDSIGHMITMNIIQAGAGAHVFNTNPEFARQALRNIEERGRAAMGELDRIIATLRGDTQATRAPLPGIEDLARLVDEARAAGMQVEAEIDAPPVSSAIGRAVFTVIREALTNAARHAPGAHVTVTVCPDGDALALAVVNGPTPGDGPHEARRLAGGGRGLAGIRDRVTLLGGRSSVGAEGEGFAVRALLPTAAVLARAAADDPSPWASLRERVAP
jgi:signal transduction histidine kinase